MHKIYEANDDFPVDNLVLTTPIVISNGVYFIKYLLDSESLYIQTPKCITRQGIIKGGKKMYCDLLFTNENNSFIKWIEDLETYSQSYIFKNRERWFDSQLELEDIADSFLSVLKIYKSGKYYILRTIVPGNADDCQLKLYDENENLINHDFLTDSTNVIPILEFKGIKCTSRNFQVDIEIKQMMILKPSLLFEKCVIKNNHESLGNKYEETFQIESDTENKKVVIEDKKEDIKNKRVVVEDRKEDIKNKKVVVEDKKEDIKNKKVVVEDKKENIENKKVVVEDKKDVIEDKNEVNKNESSYSGGFIEVDLDLETVNNEDVITLVTRNEVYYKIYQEAMNKAKQAKNLAISSYLEAKQIKNLYMLDDISDNTEEVDVLNIK